MRNKRIFAFVTIAVMLVSVFCISGCTTLTMLRNNDGHWVYDYKNEETIKELSVDINKKEATVNIEFVDDIDIISSDIYTGKYDMKYAKVSDDYVTYILTSENGSFSATISDYSIELSFWITYKKTNEEQEEIITHNVRITLHKEGNSPDPDVTEETHFDQIKIAYANAGYDVDVELGEIDQSLQSTVKMLKEMYAALGYDMSFIGKNLSNPMSMEFYMLITTHDKAGADEIAEAYNGTYPYAQHGRDIIISLSIFGEPDFDPFYTACE